jgi:predicted amidohydrolase
VIVACVQMTSGEDVAANVETAERLIRRAAGAGARLVATPEATTFLGSRRRKVALAEPVDGPTHARFGALAAELGITLLVGSVAEVADGARAFNTSLVFGPRGALLATYRKMHLFDVELAQGAIRESEYTAPGDALAVCDTDLGRLGLSVCYDLRFPELYRALVDRGAEILAVPSAFTVPTGSAHWHVLLRARAIETQCYVLAPAQWGRHEPSGRETYGHSLVVDPWGTIIAECDDGEGVCYAELDLGRVADIRRRIPVAQNRAIPG